MAIVVVVTWLGIRGVEYSVVFYGGGCDKCGGEHEDDCWGVGGKIRWIIR